MQWRASRAFGAWVIVQGHCSERSAHDDGAPPAVSAGSADYAPRVVLAEARPLVVALMRSAASRLPSDALSRIQAAVGR